MTTEVKIPDNKISRRTPYNYSCPNVLNCVSRRFSKYSLKKVLTHCYEIKKTYKVNESRMIQERRTFWLFFIWIFFTTFYMFCEFRFHLYRMKKLKWKKVCCNLKLYSFKLLKAHKIIHKPIFVRRCSRLSGISLPKYFYLINAIKKRTWTEMKLVNTMNLHLKTQVYCLFSMAWLRFGSILCYFNHWHR